MSYPLVSIIIPVFNSEKHIAETIASALAQTWPNKEIIIVDDGSKDNSVDIARGFNNAVIRIFEQENKGASAARNKGLLEAKGEYVQFLDADDLLSPNKITDQLGILDGRPDYLSISRTVYFEDGSGYSDQSAHDEEIEYYDDPVAFLIDMYYKTAATKNQRGLVTVHSWLSPKKLIEKAGWWNEELTVDDDGEFFCRVILASKGIIYVPDAINYYRKVQTSTNLSARKNSAAMHSMLLASELKCRHLKEKSDDPIVDTALAKLFMENAVTFYPQFKDLYRVAIKRVKELGGIDYVPAVGGKNIERIKKLFGWRSAKLLLFVVSRFQKPAIKK